ncbi:MAG: hypothetical protein C4519_01890 [Desulfobacteraceae bacterium]|nr:MAG: hypothetical protein C4519_01890 [Desulfobacteraceae bacterium]
MRLFEIKVSKIGICLDLRFQHRLSVFQEDLFRIFGSSPLTRSRILESRKTVAGRLQMPSE